MAGPILDLVFVAQSNMISIHWISTVVVLRHA
jgi:hypothetical protein